MESLFEKLSLDDRQVSALKKELQEDCDVTAICKAMKRLKIKWDAAAVLRYNKEKVTCPVCGATSNRGNLANHRKTKNHKKVVRAKRRARKAAEKTRRGR